MLRFLGNVLTPAVLVLLAMLAPVAAAETRPTLWVLAVGVSDYPDGDMALRFADADARAITAELARQAGGPVYGDVRTRVLIDAEVTRESIIEAMQKFFADAGPDDVAVLFVAGHGVQDRATRSYYFLPHTATFETLMTEGVRMSDFDAMVRGLRRNIGQVVVMLDTCHAGAFRFGSAVVPADDLAGRVSVGDGLYLLAATKPGEESRERKKLGHGAFTYAVLEGLRGKADGDGDGFLSISDLFGYVARRVPQLTAGQQHPYSKTEGTDLLVAAVIDDAGRPQEAALPEAVVELVSAPEANAVAVLDFENVRRDDAHEWIGRALRAALNTELSKVRELNVFSPELFDFNTRARGASTLQTAKRLGVRKMVTGAYTVVGDRVRIDVSIVDVASGQNLPGGSDHVEGEVEAFFDLQKSLTLAVLKRLQVEVSASEGAAIRRKRNIQVDALRLLLDAERGFAAPAAGDETEKDGTRGSWLPSAFEWFVRPARAADSMDREVRPTVARPTPESRKAQIALLLREYELAQERNEVDRLANVYEPFSEAHREAIGAYLATVEDLEIELSDITIRASEEGVVVAFTRRDRFVDRRSGEPVDLEVRLTKVVLRTEAGWRIAVLER